ncbi:hypothetical protein HMPREF1503_0734 [Olsenella uli MSTE5]|nr:hypothetical protein HMPREF1503_0734 [Olsenella uli MSTE5]
MQHVQAFLCVHGLLLSGCPLGEHSPSRRSQKEVGTFM